VSAEGGRGTADRPERLEQPADPGDTEVAEETRRATGGASMADDVEGEDLVADSDIGAGGD
jgi:hypothetical protein